MQRSSSCSWVRGIAEMFASQGLDVPRLFNCAGVEPDRLADPDARFTADAVSRLWELAVAWSGNATLGLDRELAARYVNFDVVGYAMLSSPNLRAALEGMARYMAVISDAATFELLAAGPDGWLVLGGVGYAQPVPRQRYAFGLLAIISVCHWLTRRDVQPLAVDFKFSEPSEVQRYRDVFRCPLRFGQPENRMLLSGADLAAALPSRDASMLQLHEHVLQKRLAALGNARTSYRVSAEIIRRLQRGEPRREDIAASLALTDRTLQRRLHAEHSSFQQLLDDARRELACKYLAEERYPLQQVAELLGFADQSNFFRACKRWFGLPPGQYRRGLARDPAGAPH